MGPDHHSLIGIRLKTKEHPKPKMVSLLLLRFYDCTCVSLKQKTLKQYKTFIVALLALCMMACNSKEGNRQFTRLIPAETGVDFINLTGENDSFNILTNEYIYNGGGVGIGDFNQDGQPDIFFSGNNVENRLYLNEGNWRFADVTETAGVAGTDRWSGGVTVVDVNADGLPDIYVCATIREEAKGRQNQLFLNTGNNENGIPTFTDVAPAYGIADTSHNTQAAWLDYDLDGDLDLFLLVNKMVSNKRPNDFSRKIVDGTGSRTDKLYRQDQVNGEIKFVEVGQETGILYQGFALAATICDLNQDGAPDIYVSNDYLSNDLVYLNTVDADGRHYFKDVAAGLLKHTSYSAMGNDVADMNNDGHPDILAVDMLPADNYRRKMMLLANNYNYLLNLERYGYQSQFVRNTLQVSQGKRIDTLTDLPNYAELAMQAGIPATDWSWTPLVADFNLDGYRDVIITNGFPRDITDHDFGDYSIATDRFFSTEQILPKIPSVKLYNEAFQANPTANGIPTYERVSTAWGIDVTSFSNGAAYADLDGDGDLDYIVNNIDDPAHIYRNNTRELSGDSHSFQLSPAKGLPSQQFFGSEVMISSNGNRQFAYWHPHRGYLSSHSNTLVFGLGNNNQVDSLLVRWIGQNNWEYFGGQAADTQITISPGGGTMLADWTPWQKRQNTLLTALEGPNFIHAERDYIDFNVQPMLLRKLSQQGPGVAVTDWNQDGVEDLYVSGSFEKAGTFLQGDAVSLDFIDAGSIIDSSNLNKEELGVLFFDADGDGDEDLYIVAGSYEFTLEKGDFHDQLYQNNNGKFEAVDGLDGLPAFSGSCVRAADYDLDGDLDLFVGARVMPHVYPLPVNSYLLRNESANGQLSFVIDQAASSVIATAENVCDALFTDYDNDGRPDLLLAGEWAPPRLYRNQPAGWEEVTEAANLSAYKGWWNSITAGDFDNDGDIDYVLGNYGENSILQPSTTEPITAFLADVDANETMDFVPMTYLENEAGERRSFPFFNRTDFAKQINKVKSEYLTHADFARTEAAAFMPPAGVDRYDFSVNHLRSTYLENTPDGFVARDLPAPAQAFPIFGMLPIDLNDDDYLDLLVIGNDYGGETGQGYLSAGNGMVLLGNGQGGFHALTAAESGFLVPGEGRGIVALKGGDNQPLIVAAQNTGPLVMVEPQGSYRYQALSHAVMVDLVSGAQRRVEAYWGSGYLGQSGRGVFLRE